MQVLTPCEEGRRLTSQDEPGRGQETPEEREPGLTAALLRIGASLDLETVPLTCARSP